MSRTRKKVAAKVVGEGPISAPEGGECHFDLAVLKGVIEHSDVGSYFGSFGSLGEYCDDAARHGWITMPDKYADGSRNIWSAKPTEAGLQTYELLELGKLPQVKFSRAYTWSWPVYSPVALARCRLASSG